MHPPPPPSMLSSPMLRISQATKWRVVTHAAQCQGAGLGIARPGGGSRRRSWRRSEGQGEEERQREGGRHRRACIACDQQRPHLNHPTPHLGNSTRQPASLTHSAGPRVQTRWRWIADPRTPGSPRSRCACVRLGDDVRLRSLHAACTLHAAHRSMPAPAQCMQHMLGLTQCMLAHMLCRCLRSGASRTSAS
jgi:hypothetical protein